MIARLARAALDAARLPAVVRARPIHAQIEPTVACNSACLGCPRDLPDEHLTAEALERILDAVRPRMVLFSGRGEPFAHPGILDFIARTAARGIEVSANSNGTLWRGREAALARSGVRAIKVSMDGATAESYRRLRNFDGFARILESLDALAREKRAIGRGYPRVTFHTVVQKGNLGELPAIVGLGPAHGVRSVYFIPPILYVGQDPGRIRRNLLDGRTTEEFLRALGEARDEARRLGVKTNLRYLVPAIRGYLDGPLSGRPLARRPVCRKPWFTIYVSAAGDAKPCCNMKYNTAPWGNVLSQDFDAVWNGPLYRSFREGHRRLDLAFEECRVCPVRPVHDFVRWVPALR